MEFQEITKDQQRNFIKRLSTKKISENFEVFKKKIQREKNIIDKILSYIKYKTQQLKNKLSKKKIKPKESEKIILSQDNSETLSELFFNICHQTFKYKF